MTRYFTACSIPFVIALVVFLSCSSCTAPPVSNDVGPSTELKTLVTRSVENWLAPRLSLSVQDQVVFSSRGYQLSACVDELTSYFATKMSDASLWDMRKLIAQIMTSQLYQSDPPTDCELFGMIMIALNGYEYHEDQD